MSSGPVLVELGADDGELFLAAVDTLSPLTVVDSFESGEPLPTPRRRRVDLTMYATDGSPDPVARSRYTNINVLDVHPCPVAVIDPDNPPPEQQCRIGLDGAEQIVRGVLGADLLSRKAVRFDFAASTMRFFPDIAGDDAARGRACDAVFSAPFHGGGTLRVSGAEVAFTGRRIAMGACLAFDASEPNDVQRGVPALFLVSTALGTTLISESAYERYRAFVGDATEVASLPTATLHLVSGPVTVRRASVNRIALVGEEAADRGPCKEMYANHQMTVDACRKQNLSGDDCPCSDATFCRTGAVLELSAGDATDIEVLVVSDSLPLLQELRDELRPGLPEVDGILGTNALAAVSLDIDYPNNRVVARCTDQRLLVCAARPKVLTVDSIARLRDCLLRTPGQL